MDYFIFLGFAQALANNNNLTSNEKRSNCICLSEGFKCLPLRQGVIRDKLFYLMQNNQVSI
jgi:hypothetical protein